MNANQLSLFGQEAESDIASTRFILSRTINGKAQRVCDHWLIPVLVNEWIFGKAKKGDEILELENTVRINGRFSYRLLRLGKEISYSGKFLELKIPSKLSFSWTEDSNIKAKYQISVDFKEITSKTNMKMSVQLPAELSGYRDTIKKQWAARCQGLAEIFRQI
ncbi:MAG: SRPBCC domain-containing protein [Gammaproteobacteria bacterium]|nr:SRPBCC domain-containing protein [Gammaproteobacteria bacterium]